ncbi:O-antigen ligase family protein [Sediminibacterium soli]|uniref:O-antigen ligase family protein n=1 Tax=Sediminibacterium soli TaxID=2698829 RepID=UPI00137B409F|nr:O-antigen ligase family protein [Sediminibacterium soli]NCI45301.1 O-antigen ligase family protein [Sediminibacterium soli]
MNGTARTYTPASILPFAFFLLVSVAAIVFRQYWLIALPFAWVLAPPAFDGLTRHASALFWLLLMAVPLSSEISFTPSLGMDLPDELLLILLTVLVLAKWIHEPRWFPKSMAKRPLIFLLAAHLAWVLVTCFYSEEPWLSVKFLLAKTWYTVPFVLLPQKLLADKRSLRKLALYLLLPMCLVVLQTMVRHAAYGFSFGDIKHIFFPFFRNHVNYAAMLVCLLALAWCTWKLTPAKNPRRKWLLYGMLLGLLALLLSYSRGAWLALAMGMAGAWLIRKKWLGITIAACLAVLIAGTCWLVQDKHFMAFRPAHDQTVFHTDFAQHLSATWKGKDISNAERFYRWVAGANMLAEKPVTGFGPNSFYLHYRPYTVHSFETWVSNNPEHSTVHNYFLLTALEQGWPGLLFFGALFIGMLLYTQKLYHRLPDRFYKTVALTIGVILIMIGTINCMSDMIETDKIGSLFWLCLGMTVWLEGRLPIKDQN